MYLIIIIIIIILIFIIYNSCEELFINDTVIFLNKTQLTNILIDNNDNYYERFNNNDLLVRNVNSIDEYKQVLVNAPVTLNNHEKSIISQNIIRINKIFNNYNIVGFSGQKASTINWHIGIIDGTLYEFGLPHTRSNIIIIPRSIIFNNNLINILVHEKIHIYQKKYLDDITNYLNYNNFNKTATKNYYRANPDIDEYLYTDKNNNLMYCKYNNEPKSILDVTYYPINESKYEHPYEFMAYNIENDIINISKSI